MSTRPSLLDRVKAGAEASGAAGLTATDICAATREVVIDGAASGLAVGDPIRILASSPPQAVGPNGFVGYLGGAAAKQVEDCIVGGFRFAGTVIEVGESRVRASIKGQVP